MGLKFLNLSLLVLLVGIGFLPPHQSLMRDKEPFYLQYLQPEKMGCHCDVHKELAQAFQKQFKESNGKISYLVSCSSTTADYTFSTLKMTLATYGRSGAPAFSAKESMALPFSSVQPTRQLSPPEPPPKLS